MNTAWIFFRQGPVRYDAAHREALRDIAQLLDNHKIPEVVSTQISAINAGHIRGERADGATAEGMALLTKENNTAKIHQKHKLISI